MSHGQLISNTLKDQLRAVLLQIDLDLKHPLAIRRDTKEGNDTGVEDYLHQS
jgi:hypothetical protein